MDSVFIDEDVKHIVWRVKDIPEGTTSLLYFVMESAEAAAPSTKDYCENVRKLFADAHKDVLTGEYGEVVTKGTVEKHTFYNLANYPGDRDQVVAQMKAEYYSRLFG